MTAQPISVANSARPRLLLAQAAIVAFILVFVLATYTVLHEGGHAIVGLLFGGTISEFDVSFWDVTAHVGIEGEFNPVQRALISVAGGGLPYLVSVLLLGLVSRRLDPVLSWTRTVGALAAINALLAWVVLPLLYTQGVVASDDSVNLLNQTKANPVLVSGVALAFYLVGWLVFVRRAGSLRFLADDLRRDKAELSSATALAGLRWLAAIFVVGTALVGGASSYLSATNPLALPPGYTLVRVVDLSERGYADEVLYRFSLEQDSTASLHFQLRNVAGGPVAIGLKGPDGYDTAFLKLGAGSGIGRATVHPRGLSLPKGTYDVRFTLPQTRGQVAIATKIEAAP